MTLFAILLAAAAVCFGTAKALHLPPLPLLLLAGIALRLLAAEVGFEIDQRQLTDLVGVGLAVLVFMAGTELSPRRVRGRVKPVVWLAVLQFLALGIAGFAAALALGYDLTVSAYLGCALSASSTLVVVGTLRTRRQLFEPYGRLVLGVLLLQDAFIVVLLVTLQKLPEGGGAVAAGLAAMTALAGLAWLLHRRVVPWAAGHLALDDEQLMVGALALLFVFCGLAHACGLPFVVGAFLAGFTLSAFPMNGLLRGMLGSLSSFFLALFFIGLGVLFVAPEPAALLHAAVLIAILVGTTVLLVTVVAERLGFSTRSAIEAGLLLSQTSEFSLLIALLGMQSGQVGPATFSTVALVTVVTMTLTPFLATERNAWRLMRLHPRFRGPPARTAGMRGHAVLVGFGRAGPAMLAELEKAGVPVLVVDDDAAVVRRLARQGVSCIQGDGSDEAVLREANAREARLLLCSLRRTRDAEKVLEWMRGSPARILVRTFERWEADLVRAAGGEPVDASRAGSDAFIEWFRSA